MVKKRGYLRVHLYDARRLNRQQFIGKYADIWTDVKRSTVSRRYYYLRKAMVEDAVLQATRMPRAKRRRERPVQVLEKEFTREDIPEAEKGAPMPHRRGKYALVEYVKYYEYLAKGNRYRNFEVRVRMPLGVRENPWRLERGVERLMDDELGNLGIDSFKFNVSQMGWERLGKTNIERVYHKVIDKARPHLHYPKHSWGWNAPEEGSKRRSGGRKRF